MTEGFDIDYLPGLKNPLLIAGFDGWGNALNISRGMADYVARQCGGRKFAVIDPDAFYRYDETRPSVRIDGGVIKSYAPPGGEFYAVENRTTERDIVVLSADEPTLAWNRFTTCLLSLCKSLGIDTIVTLGSMWDNVLHTDRIYSGMASNDSLMEKFKALDIVPIHYRGPSAIHSLIQKEAVKHDLQGFSIWSHCPFYLREVTHYGMMARLGKLLSELGEFNLDVQELERRWESMNHQIHELLEKNPNIQTIVKELRKDKVRGSWESLKDHGKGTPEKIIDIRDFQKRPEE